MLKDLKEINKRLEIINNLIPTFNTDERKEIKKNNKLINELLIELDDYKKIIYNELLNKRNSSTPKKELTYEKNNETIKFLIKELSLLNNNSYISKLELNKDIYNIINSENLEVLHNNLKDIIEKFKLIDITLSNNDFKYSITLYKYMTEYFNNINNLEFDKIMKEKFDKLYWECPDIKSHLVLNLKQLIDKYATYFNNYIKKINKDKNYNDELDKLLSLKENTDNLINTNKYLNYNLFINKELLIEDYLDNSITKKDIISKFIDYDKYLNLTDEDKNYFYKEIRGLYHSINEYLSIYNYSFLIDKVKEIYKEKEKYKNSLKELNNKINKLNKQKNKNNNKLFHIYNKLLKHSENEKLNNKYSELFNKINNQIKEIIELYKTYDETLFINDIITKLNDNSTYYDILSIYTNNYNYLMNISKDNEFNYSEFINYIYSPYLVISKNIIINNDIDIKEKIEDKYSMYNINFDIEDNTIIELQHNLKYIYNLSYYEETSLDLNKIKIITEIDKISK